MIKLKKGEKIAICAVCVLIIIVGAFLWIWVPSPPTYSPSLPTVEFNVEKVDGEYLLLVKKAEPGSDKNMSITSFKVGICNGKINEGEKLFEGEVNNLINNETSNITFYDIDNNEKISIGDKFVIKGTLTDTGNYFYLIFETHGSVMCQIKLSGYSAAQDEDLIGKGDWSTPQINNKSMANNTYL